MFERLHFATAVEPIPDLRVVLAMDSAWCVQCDGVMDVLDAHDSCATCLGPEHLREALVNPCPACSMMPLEMRRLRVAELERDSEDRLPPSGTCAGGGKRKAEAPPRPKKKRASEDTARRLAELTSSVEQLHAIIAAGRPAPLVGTETGGVQHVPPPVLRQPGPGQIAQQADALSVTASESMFADDRHGAYGDEQPVAEHNPPSHSLSGSGSGSRSGASSAASTAVPIQCALKVALARLNLDAPIASAGPPNLLRRPAGLGEELRMPQCPDYTSVLTEAFQGAMTSRADRNIRSLAAMVDPDAVGLGRMPAVEPCVASLIISPDEALRQVVRCPNAECRRTDDLLGRAYSASASLGRVGNSLTHLLLALRESLATTQDAAVCELLDASLQSVGAVANECGRSLGLLVQARRQVWLAQSPLPEPCRNSLRALPLVPGQIFGPAAQEALERRVLVSETRSRLVSAPAVRRPALPPQPQRSDYAFRPQAAPFRAPAARPGPARPPTGRGHDPGSGQPYNRREPSFHRPSGGPSRRRPPTDTRSFVKRR